MDPVSPRTLRILDAAAEIVIGDGVAALDHPRLALTTGVSVDELRELFPTWEELTAALMRAQTAEMMAVIADNIDRDPRGGLPSRIFRYALGAVFEHPFARSLYLADPEGLQRLTVALDGVQRIADLSIHPALLPALQDAAMVRDDVDATAIGAVISVLGSGVALAAPGQRIDDVTTGLVTMLERAVDADVADTAPGKAVFHRFAASLVPDALPR